MRKAAAILGLLLAGCGAAPAPAPAASSEVGGRPMRVMSINMCADQIVLALLPPERITSVSFLSRDIDASLMHAEALRVGSNQGAIEEVIRDRPDLVIAGSFTTPGTRATLKRLGYPLLEVEDALSFDGIRRATRQIAAAVGEEARAEAMIADMDRTLAALDTQRGPPIRIAAWDRAGFAAPSGSLQDEIFRAAGARNVAAEIGISGARPDVEQLLAVAPDLLVEGSAVAPDHSIGADLATHPVIGRTWPASRRVRLPQAYYACGTPRVGEAVRMLRDQLRAATRSTS